jgi:alpha-ketoglutarate-dependent taurine dioxygenase
MTGTVTPLTPHAGALITGASGADLVDRRAADGWLEALDQYGVLVFREVHITDEDFIAFSRLLGDISTTPTGEHAYPEIETITLDPSKTNKMLASLRQGNFFWHFDGSSYELPQKATLLSAQEVDEAGGDTEFASTFAAYAALPSAEQAELDGLRVVHTVAASQLRFTPEPSDKQRAAWDQIPPRVHPLVWTSPSGRKSLLLGSTAAEVVDRSVDEGQALLDRLLEWSTRPEFVVRHQWRRGDLVMWDNTGMLHRALPFEPTSRRLLHRITLAGEPAAA